MKSPMGHSCAAEALQETEHLSEIFNTTHTRVLDDSVRAFGISPSSATMKQESRLAEALKGPALCNGLQAGGGELRLHYLRHAGDGRASGS